MVKSPNDLDAVVGRNIRAYRLARRLSQTELGNKLGITFQQIQKYEKGVNRVGSGRLFEISTILGVSVTSMFEGGKAVQSKSVGESPVDLLADPLSLRLVQAFSEITERQTRHSLVALIESISASRKS
jgi:transcriptional regulator with XRE-family HTH domain